jgi:hypothetical protein
MSSTDLSPNRFPGKSLARIATVAILAISYFIVAVVLLHFLRPDLNPLRRFLSEYAVGPFGFLMTSAFFCLGLGSFALVIGLYQGVSRPGRSWIGLILLGIWSVAVLLEVIFPADLLGMPTTTTGRIHEQLFGLAVLSLIPGTFLLSWRFKNDKNWSTFQWPAMVFSIMILLVFIVFLYTNNSEFAGLNQRIFTVTVLLWLLSSAARLRQLAIQSGST